MCECITILLIIIIYQLFRLSNKDGYTDYPVGRPGNIHTAPRHRIDPEFGIRRETAIRSIQTAGLGISLIRDITPVPHNGCRPPKKRRV